MKKNRLSKHWVTKSDCPNGVVWEKEPVSVLRGVGKGTKGNLEHAAIITVKVLKNIEKNKLSMRSICNATQMESGKME
eukprot:5358283-Ditylum_brightwellii.AAC.1